MNSPQFSIITPSYNYSKYVRECIESVQAQEGVTFEHIIFDAGSTDGTLDILREYPHLHLTVEPDKGMTDAINKGFLKARGQWVMWLNTDDRLLPGALKAVAAFAEKHPEADVIHGAWNYIRSDGSHIRSMKAIPYNCNMLVGRGCYIASTALFLRKATTIDQGHLLNINFRCIMDGEYYARLGRAGKKFVSYNHPLADFRLHEAQISRAGSLASNGSQANDINENLKQAKNAAENVAIRRTYGWTPSIFKSIGMRTFLPAFDVLVSLYYIIRLRFIRLFLRWE